MLPTCAIPCGTRLFLLNGHLFSLSFPAAVFLLVSDFKFHYVVSASQANYTFFLLFFPFIFTLFLATQGCNLSHLLKLIFLRCLSQEQSYLLFIPAYLSASINPLPVRDQDSSVYHLIIIFGSFPNFSFSALKSIICIICYLHFTSSVIFQHFIFTICPEPQALCTSYAWAHI